MANKQKKLFRDTRYSNKWVETKEIRSITYSKTQLVALEKQG
jgi:hypothetical protein